MKSLRKTIAVLFSILTLTVFASAVSYADVPEDSPWYDGVQYVTENNISNGISKTSFGADTTISTAQWAAFLLRSFPANDGGLANRYISGRLRCRMRKARLSQRKRY